MKEWTFDVGEISLRGKRWREGAAVPIIALHGWLDNCASFDFIAPLLENVDLMAMDLAGQGCSDHRHDSGAYNIWLDIQEIITVADKLGWEKFGLLGHSRGAMISTLITGTFPERVTHLAVVESFAPQVVEPAKAPEQMASAINSLLDMRGKKRSLYSSFEKAVKAREQGLLKLAHQDALVLAKRGVVEHNGNFFWNNDIKLNAPSEVKFTAEQAQAFVDRIYIPVELVAGDEGLVHEFPLMKAFIDDTPNVHVHYLPGDHHLHMSQQCHQIAELFNDYFAR